MEAIAARHRLSAIVVTASDPVFNDQQAWTAQTQPAFATANCPRLHLMPEADRAPLTAGRETQATLRNK